MILEYFTVILSAQNGFTIYTFERNANEIAGT